MKHIVLTLLFLILTFVSIAQTVDSHTYKKAKVYFNNHRILKVNNLNINGMEATFTNSVSSKDEKTLMTAIKLIRIPKGNHMIEGALYGAGTLALTAVLIDIQPDALGRPQKKGADFYLGLTAGGAVIGALVGSVFPKWKEVYSGGKFLGLNLPLNLGFNPYNNQIIIKITIP